MFICPVKRTTYSRNSVRTISEVGSLGGMSRSLFFCPKMNTALDIFPNISTRSDDENNSLFVFDT